MRLDESVVGERQTDSGIHLECICDDVPEATPLLTWPSSFPFRVVCVCVCV